MISAILLAAGESKRMGTQNKLLLPFKGKPLILYILDQLAHSRAGELLIVLGHEADQLFRVLVDYSPNIVLNPYYQKGMTTSIQAGVKASSIHAKAYMICLSDLPMITTEEYDLLIQSFEERQKDAPRLILQPVLNGKRGNPVIFSSFYRNEILQHREMEGCRQIIQAHPQHLQTVDVNSDHFFRDVDTPEDYKGLTS